MVVVTGQNDHQFLTQVFLQEKSYWQRISVEHRSPRIQNVITALEKNDANLNGLIEVAKEVAKSAAEVLTDHELIREIQQQVYLPFGEEIADGAICILSLHLLDRCLSPFASRQATKLVEKIEAAIGVLDSCTTVASIHLEEFSNLLALAKVLKGDLPNSKAHAAVRRVCDVAEELTTDSAAQGFVYLRHFGQSAPQNSALRRWWLNW